MDGTREQIEKEILSLEGTGDHATDAELAERFGVTGRWIGQIRHELFEAGEIEATSDFSPQSAKWQAGRDFLKQNPKASTSQVASAVGVSDPTARKIRRDWKKRKQVEHKDWMEGDYLFPYVGSKQKIVNWTLWSVTNWKDFQESNEWARYEQENPKWFEGRFSATVPEWSRFSSLKRRTRLPDHETFVEVFGGSAATLYNKPPSQEEVYNDYNEDFAHFFETLRDHAQEICVQLEGKPYERKLYDKWENHWYGDESWYEGDDKPVDEVKRAAIFFYLRFPQHHKKDDGSGYRRPRVKRLKPKRYKNKRDRLPEFSKRFTRSDPEDLQERFGLTHQPDVDGTVTIENEDYKEILARYDSPKTLFYLDPPYAKKEEYYQNTADFDHDELVSKVTGIDGEFILSYGEVLPDGLENCRQEVMEHPTGNRLERTIFSYREDEEGGFHPPTAGGSALDW